MGKSQDKLDKKKDDFLKALELSLGNITEACKKCKIGRATYYVWLNEDPDFVEAVKYVDEMKLDLVESKAFERIVGYSHKETKVFNYKGKLITKDVIKHYPPDSGLIAFMLETKGQSRGYIKKQIHEYGTKDPFEGKTDAEINAMFEEMEAEEAAERAAEEERIKNFKDV